MVNDVFHRVADRYDLMNDLMSGGVHRLWKDAMVARLAPPKSGSVPYRVLDMAGAPAISPSASSTRRSATPK
jgi:demethylmenaquinone methyltransferase/2-methoxy-6-polyprenyl-1,4-benzoquinol methylase